MSGTADEVLTEAAAYVIREKKPHLLAIHLNVLDDNEHRYGSDHYMANAALTMVDYCLGLLLRAVADAGRMDSTTLFVVADHGFQTVRQEVNLHPFFAESGLDGKASLHPDGWYLYVELEKGFEKTDKQGLDSTLNEILKAPGIARVMGPEGFHELGYPRYEEDVHVPGQYLIVADADTHLVIDPSSTSRVRRQKARPYHGHGYLPSHPSMFPALLLAGHGIREGFRMGTVSNLDIAPTIAHLLGLELPETEGRILTEALTIP